MKIRILENSIRIRVSITEMAQLSDGKEIDSKTVFPSATLFVKIIPSNFETLVIDFIKHEISILIPLTTLQKLNNSDEVGFSHGIALAKGSLNLLFEKDFQCLSERAEDQSGLYKNPRESH